MEYVWDGTKVMTRGTASADDSPSGMTFIDLLVEDFRENVVVADAETLGFDLEAVALEGLSVGACKIRVELDVSVAGEVLVALEACESVALGVVVAAALVVAVDAGDLHVFRFLSIFSHGENSFQSGLWWWFGE